MTTDVRAILAAWHIPEDRQPVHYAGCERFHPWCAIRAVAERLDREERRAEALAEALASLGVAPDAIEHVTRGDAGEE